MAASTGILLVLLGSDGKTRAEIEQALQLNDSPIFTASTFENDLQMAYRYALAVLHRTAREEGKLEDETGAFQVFRINKLFVDASIQLEEDFVSRVRKLRGEISFIDFRNSSSSARQEVNDYVEDKMNGKVTECFAPGTINKHTQLVLANGICFRARFDVTFDADLTTVQPFYQLDGKVVNVKTMNGTFFLPVVQDFGREINYIEIPYAFNSASLLLFIPMKKDGLTEMLHNLNPATFNQINLVKRLREVQVALPKFKMQTQLDMKSLLKKIGVVSLFTEHADLSRMSQEQVALTAAVHNGYFSVDELGTDTGDTKEKMSKTTVSSSVLSFSDLKMKLSKPKSNPAIEQKTLNTKSPIAKIRADRSFLFAVRHNQSGIMVCLGRVETL